MKYLIKTQLEKNTIFVEQQLTSGNLYNFSVRCIVMLRLRCENFTSINFRGFKDRCQYLLTYTLTMNTVCVIFNKPILSQKQVFVSCRNTSCKTFMPLFYCTVSQLLIHLIDLSKLRGFLVFFRKCHIYKTVIIISSHKEN